MKKCNKTLTMTWINNYNYGSILQAYALQFFLKKNGYQNKIVDYNPTSYERIKNLLISGNSFKLFYYKFKGLISKINSRTHKVDFSGKREKFVEFKKKYIETTETIYHYKGLKSLSNKFDTYICGSDQIWNPELLNPAFYLSFVDDSSRKISYATSFGVEDIPSNKSIKIKQLIASFDRISLREESAVEIVKKMGLKDINPVLTVDPTLLLSTEEWNSIIYTNNTITNGYLLCYFLTENKNYWDNVRLIANQKGLDIKIIPNSADSFTQKGEVIKSVGPIDFISLIKSADTVITDSFHGIIFSIIFHKDFYAYRRFDTNDKFSQNSRVNNLLKLLNLESRLFDNNSQIIISDKKIEYTKIDKRLSDLRIDSEKYIFDALETSKNNICEYCTSCRCCESICPVGAISMIEDAEGFLKPSINNKKCINCKLCERKCPQNTNKKYFKYYGKAYAARINDNEILNNSTSGGIFSALAIEVINQKGIVYGTTIDSKFNVYVKRINKLADLKTLQGSKYVTSDVGKSYVDIKKDLLEQKKVLFCGVPCQVAGLRSYLGKEYDNLILIDLICHGSPSLKLFKKYLQYEEIKNKEKVKKFIFRDKKQGWGVYWKLIFSKKRSKGGLNDNPYISCFINGEANKMSCYHCRYRGFENRAGDITLGDYWGIDEFHPSFASNRGCSAIIVNNEKALSLLEKVLEGCEYIIDQKENIAKNNPSLVLNQEIPERRYNIYRGIDGNSYEYVKKQLKINKKLYLKTKVRLMIPYQLRILMKKIKR